MISLVSGVFSSSGMTNPMLGNATLGSVDGLGQFVTGGMSSLLADGAAGGANGMFALGNILPILLMFVIFYVVLIRPQQKRQRELQDWLSKLDKNEEVVTTGGLWGKILSVSEKSPYVTLELQEKVRVRVLRSHIAMKAPANDATGLAAANDAAKK